MFGDEEGRLLKPLEDSASHATAGDKGLVTPEDDAAGLQQRLQGPPPRPPASIQGGHEVRDTLQSTYWNSQTDPMHFLFDQPSI